MGLLARGGAVGVGDSHGTAWCGSAGDTECWSGFDGLSGVDLLTRGVAVEAGDSHGASRYCVAGSSDNWSGSDELRGVD